MELNTIKQIRELRDSIRGKIKDIDLRNPISDSFGTEKEYNYRGVIGDIEKLLTDISTLTKAPKKFVRISTHTERTQIISHLTRIQQYLENPTNYLAQFEALKILLRSYNVRYFSERHIEFEKEIEEVKKIKLELQQLLTDASSIKESIDETDSLIDDKLQKSKARLISIDEELVKIIEKKEYLIEQSGSLKEINTTLDSIKETASENLEEISTSMTESKSNEKLITSFANKIQDRDNKLDELEQSIEENKTKLNEYEKERKSILQEANQLIESAKKALNYKTAVGISASFQQQYEKSNNKWVFGSWILGALFCLIGTIALGIWILQTNPSNIGLLIGRISLLPLPIIGAIFCANQYTKQKNIIEDYAYKMVLSKAIVGFSEQLKKNGTENNEEYIHYIKTALEEIHRDPLRKRERSKQRQSDNKDSNLKDVVELAEKIVKMTKIE